MYVLMYVCMHACIYGGGGRLEIWKIQVDVRPCMETTLTLNPKEGSRIMADCGVYRAKAVYDYAF